jgi:hypothetical protein
METQPFPVSTSPSDRGPYSYRCKRTSQRARLFNMVASQALSVLVRVPPRIKHTTYVETFDMLSAIIEASADHAHLVGYLPALNALTQMVLGTLCSE